MLDIKKEIFSNIISRKYDFQVLSNCCLINISFLLFTIFKICPKMCSKNFENWLINKNVHVQNIFDYGSCFGKYQVRDITIFQKKENAKSKYFIGNEMSVKLILHIFEISTGCLRHITHLERHLEGSAHLDRVRRRRHDPLCSLYDVLKRWVLHRLLQGLPSIFVGFRNLS